MDAFVHAIESYVSPRATTLTRTHALRSIELISSHLRRAVANGKTTKRAEAMSWGSLIAGFSFANAGVGGVHALAYPLGGQFHVSHGVSNALLLPHVMRFSVSGKPALFADMAPAMNVRRGGAQRRTWRLWPSSYGPVCRWNAGIPQAHARRRCTGVGDRAYGG